MTKKTIILDGLRFDYTAIEIAKFRVYWNEYIKFTRNRLSIIKQIADDMEEDADNIMLLALDQARKGKI